MIPSFPIVVNGKRADSMAIKQRLGDLLPLQQGEAYWNAFGSFLTGHSTRDEFDMSTDTMLKGEAAELHNALIFSVLYNVTIQSQPPSTRHSGWFPKRKRDLGKALDQKGDEEERDPKRKRIKHTVMSLTKRERNRLKGLASSTLSQERLNEPLFFSMKESMGPGKSLSSTSVSLPGKNHSAAFQQDYARCQQASLCAESLTLPDLETLRDRMSYIAYCAGLQSGTDASAASALSAALEMHLKNILSAAIKLKANQLDSLANSEEGYQASRRTSAAITLPDVADLLEINPSIFGRPLLGALERDLALCPRLLENMSGRMTKLEIEMQHNPKESHLLQRKQNETNGNDSSKNNKNGISDKSHSTEDIGTNKKKKNDWDVLVDPISLFSGVLQ